MKVQVINNDGVKVWEFDPQQRQDSSGSDWNGEKNTEIMAGVVGVLHLALTQAEVRPADWKWPFNGHLEGLLSSTSGPLAVFQLIAHRGVDGGFPLHCMCGCQRNKSDQ
ncbi:hypothetical protein ACR9GP_05955 [Enterobacter ludwigii]